MWISLTDAFKRTVPDKGRVLRRNPMKSTQLVSHQPICLSTHLRKNLFLSFWALNLNDDAEPWGARVRHASVSNDFIPTHIRPRPFLPSTWDKNSRPAFVLALSDFYTPLFSVTVKKNLGIAIDLKRRGGRWYSRGRTRERGGELEPTRAVFLI